MALEVYQKRADETSRGSAAVRQLYQEIRRCVGRPSSCCRYLRHLTDNAAQGTELVHLKRRGGGVYSVAEGGCWGVMAHKSTPCRRSQSRRAQLQLCGRTNDIMKLYAFLPESTVAHPFGHQTRGSTLPNFEQPEEER